MRKDNGKPHLYYERGTWMCIQWFYGPNASFDVLLHGRGKTPLEAFNNMH